MDNEKKYNYYKEANDRIYEQLTFAEAKNGVLVGLYTAIIFGLINLFFECLPCWGKIILSISLGFMAIGMIMETDICTSHYIDGSCFSDNRSRSCLLSVKIVQTSRMK